MPLVTLPQLVASKISNKLTSATLGLRSLALPHKEPPINALHLDNAAATDTESKLSIARSHETHSPITANPVIQLLGTHFREVDVRDLNEDAGLIKVGLSELPSRSAIIHPSVVVLDSRHLRHHVHPQ